MPAAIVGDHSVALGPEEQHLRIPRVGIQWPAVGEHDGLSRSPVLVKDVGAVFGGDEWHGGAPFDGGGAILTTHACHSSAGVSATGSVCRANVGRIMHRPA